MVNVNENEVNESSNQSELSDEGIVQPSGSVDASQDVGGVSQDAGATSQDAAGAPQEDDLASQAAKSDPLSGSAQNSGESMESVMNLYEESFKRFAEGEVVTGRIISVDKDYVLVDIGYKSEGQIRTHEFKNDDGNISAEIGDSVEVMVEWWDDEEERVVLSREKASNIKTWDAIKNSYDEDGTVKGVISNRVKGGFSVDIGVPAFLPGSQADLRPIRNLDEMVGKTYEFKILKYNRKRSNIVLSRRAILEKEREEKRARRWHLCMKARLLKASSKISPITVYSSILAA